LVEYKKKIHIKFPNVFKNKILKFMALHLNLENILVKNTPELLDKESDIIVMEIVDKLKYNDFIYKNYILNELDNTFYDVYNSIDSDITL
jgi:hypothetical protein